MFLFSRRSFLRGGFYHLALILVTASSFNWGFLRLTGVDLATRIFSGITIPQQAIALALCLSAVIVLWNNWVD